MEPFLQGPCSQGGVRSVRALVSRQRGTACFVCSAAFTQYRYCLSSTVTPYSMFHPWLISHHLPPRARAPHQAEAMERARAGLKHTMGRLNKVYRQAQSNHMLALVLFAVVLFVGIYIIAKIYRLGRHVLG